MHAAGRPRNSLLRALRVAAGIPAAGFQQRACFQTRRGRDALSCRLRSKADICEIGFQSPGVSGRNDSADIAIRTHEHPVARCQTVGIMEMPAFIDESPRSPILWICRPGRGGTAACSTS